MFLNHVRLVMAVAKTMTENKDSSEAVPSAILSEMLQRSRKEPKKTSGQGITCEIRKKRPMKRNDRVMGSFDRMSIAESLTDPKSLGFLITSSMKMIGFEPI
jgi:hypothetical protein